MRRTSIVATLAALAIAAPNLIAADPVEQVDGVPVCDDTPLAFRRAVRLGSGQGYEPGIEIDSAGNIFVTAHKLSLAAEGERTASWLWRSTDGGATFDDMVGLMGVSDKFYALEGDLAVDGNDRLYFVDTWAADNHVYRWSDGGATLDFVRPAVPSAEVDDRPWLAAHGDGYVYYLSNTGYGLEGRLTVHRSTDGGQTFDPVGFTFAESGWGFLDADPNSEYVYAFMDDLFYGTGLLGAGTEVGAWISPDRGETWSRVKVADYEVGSNSDGYPTIAVSPVDGSLAALWADGRNTLKLARSFDHGETWEVHDVTPFAGDFGYPWVTIGPSGDIALVFSASPDSESGNQHNVYGMIWSESSDCIEDPAVPGEVCHGPAGRFARLQPRAAGGTTAQADFFQVELHPEDASINVAFTDAVLGDAIVFTRQTEGPNMNGRPYCGLSGEE